MVGGRMGGGMEGGENGCLREGTAGLDSCLELSDFPTSSEIYPEGLFCGHTQEAIEGEHGLWCVLVLCVTCSSVQVGPAATVCKCVRLCVCASDLW